VSSMVCLLADTLYYPERGGHMRAYLITQGRWICPGAGAGVINLKG
jgi:hypothetical protein